MPSSCTRRHRVCAIRPWCRSGVARPSPCNRSASGFPCFGAALAGYVEATIDGDENKNRLCPPSPLSDTPADWGAMQVLGYRASKSFMSHPDIRAWANEVPLNPARIPAGGPRTAELDAAVERFRTHEVAGMARLGEFGSIALS